MKTLLAAALLVAHPLFALDTDCTAQMKHLRLLYELRSLMMKTYTTSADVDRFIDKRLDDLREPAGDGSYRWVRWARPTGDASVSKESHNVLAVQDKGEADRWEAAGSHAFAVRVVVPRKRSLFNANHPVFVKQVVIDYTVDGRRQSKTESINGWMNPDTSRTIDLGAIAERVDAAVSVATAAKHAKESLVEIHFRLAVPQDDPANPAYLALQALKRIQSDADAATIDSEIAALEHELFPGVDSFPQLTFVTNLRQADELMRSEKPENVSRGEALLKDTLRRMR